MKIIKIILTFLLAVCAGTSVFGQMQQMQARLDPETLKKETREVERAAKKNVNALALLAAITQDKTKSETYWTQAAQKGQPEALYRQFLVENPELEPCAVDTKTTAKPPENIGEIKDLEKLKTAAGKKYAPAMFLLAQIYTRKGMCGAEILPLMFEALEVATTVYGVDIGFKYLMEFSASYDQVEKLKAQIAEAPAEAKEGEMTPQNKWAMDVAASYDVVKKLVEAPTATGYWVQANQKSPGTPLDSNFADRSISKGNIWATALQYLNIMQTGALDEKTSNKYKRIFDKNPNVRGDIAVLPRNFSMSLTNESQVLNYTKSENKFNKKFAIESAAPTEIRKAVWDYNLRNNVR